MTTDNTDITPHVIAWLLAMRANELNMPVSVDAIGDTALRIREIIDNINIEASLCDFETCLEAVDTFIESMVEKDNAQGG